MDKNFNSFHQMLEGLGQKSFRSFKDWAQNMNGVPESQEKREIEAAPPVTPVPINEVQEPAVEPVSEKKPVQAPEKDIISTLMENLADFEWTGESEETEEEQKYVSQEPAKPVKPVESLRTEPIRVKEEKQFSERPKERIEEKVKHYRVFRDKEENFECNLKVEGTSLSDAKVRIVLESDSWNFVFHGEIYGDGRCVVPIKKGIPLIEGAVGSIKLEVIAEDQLFVGWEDTFKVETSKKIKVEVKDKKSISVDFNNRFDRNR
jgi:hypothetical protein